MEGKEISSIKKVVILGIDALEYTLVEEWDLKYLKQKEYGKVEVPIYKFAGEPVTLVVWPCFITGAEPDEMGYDSAILYRQPLKFLLDHSYLPIQSLLEKKHRRRSIEHKKDSMQRIISRLNYISMKAGLGRYPRRSDIKVPTFFENTKYRSINLHVPVYDESHTLEDNCNPRNNVIGALSDKTLRKDYDNTLNEEFKERSKEVFKILETNNWDLFMQYFYVLDGIQHVFFNKKFKIMNYYLKFNEFVGKVKKKIDDDTLLLIIADHGQKNGVHTMYGFYSSNIKLGLDHPKISDFKEIIEKKLLH